MVYIIKTVMDHIYRVSQNYVNTNGLFLINGFYNLSVNIILTHPVYYVEMWKHMLPHLHIIYRVSQNYVHT